MTTSDQLRMFCLMQLGAMRKECYSQALTALATKPGILVDWPQFHKEMEDEPLEFGWGVTEVLRYAPDTGFAEEIPLILWLRKDNYQMVAQFPLVYVYKKRGARCPLGWEKDRRFLRAHGTDTDTLYKKIATQAQKYIQLHTAQIAKEQEILK